MNINKKKTGATVLISDSSQNKEQYQRQGLKYIMTKELIYQEDVAILNIYIQDRYKVREAKTDTIEEKQQIHNYS